jgi:hypothetical protein
VSEARIRACRVRCASAQIARKTAVAEKQNKAAQAAAIEPFSRHFFAPRHALKFHKNSYLQAVTLGCTASPFRVKPSPI